MSSLRGTEGKRVLKQAKDLLDEVQQAIKAGDFGCDEVRMKTYNDLIAAASRVFYDDPVLNGQLIKMPDGVLQAYAPEHGGLLPIGIMPSDLPSKRTEQHLKCLVNRLELLLGEESDERTFDERDFSFVTSPELRRVLVLDYMEAQRAFNAGAYKACGLLCGGLIEGMLLDSIKRPEVATEQQLIKLAGELRLPREGRYIRWDRIGMAKLIKLSVKLSLIKGSALKYAEGARDVRDTVHPRAEVRQGHRVLADEAEILLKLVALIYDLLASKFGGEPAA